MSHYSDEKKFLKAAEKGDSEFVNECLRNGINASYRDEYNGWTALHQAAKFGRLEVVKLLLEAPSTDVNCVESKFGSTALHKAAYFGHVDVSRTLIEAGASVSAQNYCHHTPLHFATNGLSSVSAENRASITFLLLEHGADPTLRNKYSQIPLDAALEEPDLCKAAIPILQQAMAEVGATSIDSHAEKRPQLNDLGGEANHWPQEMQQQWTINDWLLSRDLFTKHEAIEIASSMYVDNLTSPYQVRILKKETISSWSQENNLSAIQTDKLLYMHHELQQVSDKPTSSGKIFICHTGQDQDASNFASYLAETLHVHGFDYFFDAHSLRAGVRWKAEIERNVQKCAVFVCVLSKTFFFRYWCLHELDLALQSNKKIVPVHFNCGPPEVNESFQLCLRDVLNEKSKQVSEETLSRWYRNIAELHEIQGIHNYSNGKDSQVAFIKKTVAEVKGLIK